MTTRLVLPIRDFAGMTRLATILSAGQRSRLAQDLASRMLVCGAQAGCEPIIVTRDRDVVEWAAEVGAEVVPDIGSDLDEAAATGIAGTQTPWVVAHADLPFVTVEALTEVVECASTGVVLVPSVDGGTNAIGGTGSFPFSYGPGSFHRHLAVVPNAKVLPSRALSVEVDTPIHLMATGIAGSAAATL